MQRITFQGINLCISRIVYVTSVARSVSETLKTNDTCMNSRIVSFISKTLFTAALALTAHAGIKGDVTDFMGGGNFINGMEGRHVDECLKVLSQTRYSMIRLNVYPGKYLTQHGQSDGKPTPERIDTSLTRLLEHDRSAIA